MFTRQRKGVIMVTRPHGSKPLYNLPSVSPSPQSPSATAVVFPIESHSQIGYTHTAQPHSAGSVL